MSDMFERAMNSVWVVYGGAGVLAFIAIALITYAIKSIGWRFVSNVFDKKLEQFKFQQLQEMELIKHNFTKSMDRRMKINQIEYEVLPEAWRLLSQAYSGSVRTILGSTSIFMLNHLTWAQSEKALLADGFTSDELDDIKRSEDMDATYRKYVSIKDYNVSVEPRVQYSRYIRQNGIFISPELKSQFHVISELIENAMHDALHNIHTDRRDRQWEAIAKFRSEGREKMDELEAILHARLWSDVALTDA
ncbi:hypothetical protein [Methylobacterium sp. E-045]|uniref:hypothetical protein n=1 Tax=Methylobacterium sp. E-045 TaxID=2836575 RepID=UPI001FBBDA4F|nr:hypothetical protein [Methylobacterium sp. E-045]MCJ2129238.1 hypothetical protein [Methylobacterium sp. E-045]